MKIIIFRYFQILAIFTLGAIVGASLMNFQIGQKIDQLHQQNDVLVSEVEDKEIMINELDKSLKSLEGEKYVVKSISIHIELEKEDEFTQLELEKQVKDMLLSIIGRELEEIDPLSVPTIINKRRVLIENTEYLLEVENSLISEEIVMYIKATKHAPSTHTSED